MLHKAEIKLYGSKSDGSTTTPSNADEYIDIDSHEEHPFTEDNRHAGGRLSLNMRMSKRRDRRKDKGKDINLEEGGPSKDRDKDERGSTNYKDLAFSVALNLWRGLLALLYVAFRILLHQSHKYSIPFYIRFCVWHARICLTL